ncbi:MAG TPA: hypothetical protein VMV06_06730 [Acidimicrobiales bacterium]|nr:hypothetical protein [Acidimicrobiales bacterium]
MATVRMQGDELDKDDEMRALRPPWIAPAHGALRFGRIALLRGVRPVLV